MFALSLRCGLVAIWRIDFSTAMLTLQRTTLAVRQTSASRLASSLVLRSAQGEREATQRNPRRSPKLSRRGCPRNARTQREQLHIRDCGRRSRAVRDADGVLVPARSARDGRRQNRVRRTGLDCQGHPTARSLVLESDSRSKVSPTRQSSTVVGTLQFSRLWNDC